MKRPRMTDERYGHLTGLGFLTLIAGFALFFVLLVSWAMSEDYTESVSIPNSDCEVIEHTDRNLWFTPGETTTTSKIVCTTVVDKVDIGR